MFLANENFPGPSIQLLRSAGIVVYSIAESHPGISDPEVIEIAQKRQLIILTFDSDYGELLFRYGSENPPAVVYFREKGNSPRFAGEFLLKRLADNPKMFDRAFSVIGEKSIRQRFFRQP